MLVSKKSSALILLSILAIVACAPKKSSPASETAAAPAAAPAGTLKLTDTLGDKANKMIGTWKGITFKTRKTCLLTVAKIITPHYASVGVPSGEASAELTASLSVPSDPALNGYPVYITQEFLKNGANGNVVVDQTGQFNFTTVTGVFGLINRSYFKFETKAFAGILTSAHIKSGTVQVAFIDNQEDKEEINCVDLKKVD